MDGSLSEPLVNQTHTHLAAQGCGCETVGASLGNPPSEPVAQVLHLVIERESGMRSLFGRWNAAVVIVLAAFNLGCQPKANQDAEVFYKSKPITHAIDSTDATVLAAVDELKQHSWPGPLPIRHARLEHTVVFQDFLESPSGHKRGILVLASRSEDHTCHYCGPQISLFAWDASAHPPAEWLAKAIYAEEIGSWGDPPQARLEKLPAGKAMLFLKDINMNGGVESTTEVGFRIQSRDFHLVFRQFTDVNQNDCPDPLELGCDDEPYPAATALTH